MLPATPSKLIDAAEAFCNAFHSIECANSVAPILLPYMRNRIIMSINNNNNNNSSSSSSDAASSSRPLRYDTRHGDLPTAFLASSKFLLPSLQTTIATTSSSSSAAAAAAASSSPSLHFVLHVDTARLLGFSPILGRLCLCEPRAADIIFSAALWRICARAALVECQQNHQEEQNLENSLPLLPFDPTVFVALLCPRRRPFDQTTNNNNNSSGSNNNNNSSSILDLLLSLSLTAAATRSSLETVVEQEFPPSSSSGDEDDNQQKQQQQEVASIRAQLHTAPLPQRMLAIANINSPLMATSSLLSADGAAAASDGGGLERCVFSSPNASSNGGGGAETTPPVPTLSGRFFFCSAGEAIGGPLLTSGRVSPLLHFCAVVVRTYRVRRPGGVVEVLPVIKVQEVAARRGGMSSSSSSRFDFATNTDIDVVFPLGSFETTPSGGGGSRQQFVSSQNPTTLREVGVSSLVPGAVVDIAGRVTLFDVQQSIFAAAHTGAQQQQQQQSNLAPVIFALSCTASTTTTMTTTSSRVCRSATASLMQTPSVDDNSSSTVSFSDSATTVNNINNEQEEEQQEQLLFHEALLQPLQQFPDFFEEELYSTLREHVCLLAGHAFRSCSSNININNNDRDQQQQQRLFDGVFELTSLFALPPQAWLSVVVAAAVSSSQLSAFAVENKKKGNNKSSSSSFFFFHTSIFAPVGQSRQLFQLLESLQLHGRDAVIVADTAPAGSCGGGSVGCLVSDGAPCARGGAGGGGGGMSSAGGGGAAATLPSSTASSSAAAAPLPLRNFTKSLVGSGALEAVCAGQMERAACGAMAILDLTSLSKDQLVMLLRSDPSRAVILAADLSAAERERQRFSSTARASSSFSLSSSHVPPSGGGGGASGMGASPWSMPSPAMSMVTQGGGGGNEQQQHFLHPGIHRQDPNQQQQFALDDDDIFKVPDSSLFFTQEKQQQQQNQGDFSASPFVVDPAASDMNFSFTNNINNDDDAQHHQLQNNHHMSAAAAAALPQALVAFATNTRRIFRAGGSAGGSAQQQQQIARFAERCDTVAAVSEVSGDSVDTDAAWTEYLAEKLLAVMSESNNNNNNNNNATQQYLLLQNSLHNECVAEERRRRQFQGQFPVAAVLREVVDAVSSTSSRVFADALFQQQQQQQNDAATSAASPLRYSCPRALLLIKRYVHVATRKFPTMLRSAPFASRVCRIAVLHSAAVGGLRRQQQQQAFMTLGDAVVAICLTDASLHTVLGVSVFSATTTTTTTTTTGNLLSVVGNRFACGPQLDMSRGGGGGSGGGQEHQQEHQQQQQPTSFPDLILHNVLVSGLLPETLGNMFEALA